MQRRLTAQFFAGICVGVLLSVLGEWLWNLAVQGMFG